MGVLINLFDGYIGQGVVVNTCMMLSIHLNYAVCSHHLLYYMNYEPDSKVILLIACSLNVHAHVFSWNSRKSTGNELKKNLT